jgi:hypothetical protein
MMEEREVIVNDRVYKVLCNGNGVRIAPVGEEYQDQYLLWEAILSITKLKNEAWQESGGNIAECERLWVQKIVERGQKVLARKAEPRKS